jgi:hypothetical protein
MGIDTAVSIFLSAVAILLSIYNFNRSRTVTMYQDLDSLYLELIKLAIANPGFVNPELTGDYKKNFVGDQKLQYELYAFMVWNVCETIYDRRSIKSFFKTWECIIKVENKLHRNWFDTEENHCRFKDEFVNYIRQSPQEKSVSGSSN